MIDIDYLDFFITRSFLSFISFVAAAATTIRTSRAAPATKQNTLESKHSKLELLRTKLTHLDREFDLDLERDPERDLDGLREGLRLPERDRWEPERDLADLFDAALRRDRRDPTLPASEPLPEKLLASESDIFDFHKRNVKRINYFVPFRKSLKEKSL